MTVSDTTHVRVILSADARSYVREVSRAGQATSAADAANKDLARSTRTTTEETKKAAGAHRAAAEATSEAAKAADELESSTKTSALAWGVLGTAVTLAGARLVAVLQQSVQAASNLQESTSKMERVFGAASGTIVEYAKNVGGLSKRATFDAASTMALFGKSAGLAGEELAGFSTDMVTLSVDLASFFNTNPEDAMHAIGSALRGESEAIRAYNVLLDEATLQNRAFEMGIISSNKNALTPQQKILAVQAEILAQTSDAQGDYTRTSEGLANAQRDLAASMEDAQAALGEALLPAMASATGGAADLLEAFVALPEPIQATTTAIMAAVAALALLGPAVAGVRAGLAALGVGVSVATLGALAAIFGTVAGAATAVHKSAEYQRGKGIDKMVESMKAATAAGEEFDSVLSVTLGGGEVMTGLDELVAGLDKSERVVKQLTPAFEALDAYLSDLSKTDVSGARQIYDDLIASAEAAGGSQQEVADRVAEVKALLPEYMDVIAGTAQANADAAASEREKAAAIAESTAALRDATAAAYAYIDANLAQAGRADALVGQQDRLRASLMGPASSAGGGGGGSGSSKSAKAEEAEQKALQKTIDKIREKDAVQEKAEIKRARERAQAKAEARADRGAQADVQAGAAAAIATDQAARRGEHIEDFNQDSTVGEAKGELTKGEEKALDKKIDGIRARHQKSVDAQVKALRDSAKATGAAGKAASGGAKAYNDMSNSLDDNTAAGLRNRDTFRKEAAAIVEFAKGVEAAALEAGKTPAQAAKEGHDALVILRADLVESAEKAGFTRDEVVGYLEEIKFTDKDFDIKFKLILETAEAERKQAELYANIAKTWGPGKGKKWNPALGAWVNWDGPVAKPIVTKPTPKPSVAPKLPKGGRPDLTWDSQRGGYYAGGGEIRGPGGPKADKVPLWASAGEFVVNAASYSANRDLVRAINASSGRVSGGMNVGTITVNETTGNRVRMSVIDALAESAYRSGAVR